MKRVATRTNTEFDRVHEQQEKCLSSRMITIQLGGEWEGRKEKVSSVAEPLFLNRGAIATPKSRPARTWTGLSVLYLSSTKYRRRWPACTRILRTRTYAPVACLARSARVQATHALRGSHAPKQTLSLPVHSSRDCQSSSILTSFEYFRD